MAILCELHLDSHPQPVSPLPRLPLACGIFTIERMQTEKKMQNRLTWTIMDLMDIHCHIKWTSPLVFLHKPVETAGHRPQWMLARRGRKRGYGDSASPSSWTACVTWQRVTAAQADRDRKLPEDGQGACARSTGAHSQQTQAKCERHFSILF